MGSSELCYEGIGPGSDMADRRKWSEARGRGCWFRGASRTSRVRVQASTAGISFITIYNADAYTLVATASMHDEHVRPYIYGIMSGVV